MEVGKITAYTVGSNQKTRETGSRGPAKEAGLGSCAGGKADRVEFSKGCREMLQARRAALEDNEVRTERVEQLRSLVEADKYMVEPEALADRLLEAFW